jgi:ParB family chromosome partitioning protein
MLKPGSVKGSDRRAIFVGVDAYKEAGGKIGGDLFAEETLFDNPDILHEVFAAKLDAAAKALHEAEGWKWVEAVEDSYVCSYRMGLDKFGRVYPVEGVLSEEQAERYDELEELAASDVLDEAGQAELATLQVILDGDFTDEQKAVAGAYAYVDREGELRLSAGLVKPEDKKAAVEAGLLRASAHSTNSGDSQPKSPISAKLADDLSRIARGARQHAILRDPELMVDLLAYQLSHSLRWSNAFGISLSDVPNWPTTEADGYELDERLTSNPPRDMWDAKDLGASFRAFRKKGSDHIRGELARFLAAQYQGGDEKLEAMIDKETQPNIREVWTPTAENFFKRVGGPYLNTLWRDLLGLAVDHPTITTFQKLKKGEKVTKLHDLFNKPDVREAMQIGEDAEQRVAAWLPEGME